MLIRSLPVVLCVSLLFQACAPTLPFIKKNDMKLPEKYPKYTEASKSTYKNGLSAAEVNWKGFLQIRAFCL